MGGLFTLDFALVGTVAILGGWLHVRFKWPLTKTIMYMAALGLMSFSFYAVWECDEEFVPLIIQFVRDGSACAGALQRDELVNVASWIVAIIAVGAVIGAFALGRRPISTEEDEAAVRFGGSEAAAQEAAAQTAFEAVKHQEAPEEYEIVARRFPDTFYGELAATRAEKLREPPPAPGFAPRQPDPEAAVSDLEAQLEEAREAAAEARKAAEDQEAAIAAERAATERMRALQEEIREQEAAAEAERQRAAELKRKAEAARRAEEERKQAAEAAARRKAQERRRKRATPFEVFRDPLKSGGEGPEMVVIPAGEFLMGSPDDEEGRLDCEGPQQRIQIPQPFALGKHAVTFEAYDLFCDLEGEGREKPHDQGWGLGHRPVINVDWEDAQAYCAWLSGETGKEYRLPSEAEWEYACRAGSETPFEPTVAHACGGRTITPDEANYYGNYPYADGPKGVHRGETVPVAHSDFFPNAWGLWQMHGNVWEWCADEWVDTLAGIPADGSPRQVSKQDSGERVRVLRGGSWYDSAGRCRSACRGYDPQDGEFNDFGFRCALRLDP